MSTIANLFLKRLGTSMVTLLLVSAVVFLITNLLPGDPAQAMLGQAATPEVLEALRVKLGLDQPPHIRYLNWLGALLSGDPGVSLANNMPIAELVSDRLPRSLLLAGITAVVAVPFALFVGIMAAMYSGSRVDRFISSIVMFIVAVPEFLVATTAVLIFAVQLGWLSSVSYAPPDPSLSQFLATYALPVMTLCLVLIGQMARMTRSALIEQMQQPYVEMAVLKGASHSRLVLRHALPNAVGPIANAVALSLSYLMGGVVIVEVIFNYPGIASLMVDSVTNRDFPLLQVCAMLFCTGYLILVLMADVCAILSNPKLRK
ncbi:MAG: ABC transporter permease [Exilibacterium sp.]